MSRGIGVLSKLRHFTNAEILKQLYYTLIYPFLTFGLITRGNTYITTLKPLIILQKKAVRVITFSDFRKHSSPLFDALSIIKLIDLIFFYVAMFMYDFYTAKFPNAFEDLFKKISNRHAYNTSLASRQSYSLPSVRTNYGKFNLRFIGAKIWNTISDDKKRMPKHSFKEAIKSNLLNSY